MPAGDIWYLKQRKTDPVRKDAMYKIFLLIAIPGLAIAWTAYALWIRKVRKEEEKRPRVQSKRLRKTKSEMADWAEKMGKYERPKYKRPSDEDKSGRDKQNKTNKPT